MNRFLTIGFLGKVSPKKKNKEIDDNNAEINEMKLMQAKEHLRSFIGKQ